MIKIRTSLLTILMILAIIASLGIVLRSDSGIKGAYAKSWSDFGEDTGEPDTGDEPDDPGGGGGGEPGGPAGDGDIKPGGPSGGGDGEPGGPDGDDVTEPKDDGDQGKTDCDDDDCDDDDCGYAGIGTTSFGITPFSMEYNVTYHFTGLVKSGHHVNITRATTGGKAVQSVESDLPAAYSDYSVAFWTTADPSNLDWIQITTDLSIRFDFDVPLDNDITIYAVDNVAYDRPSTMNTLAYDGFDTILVGTDLVLSGTLDVNRNVTYNGLGASDGDPFNNKHRISVIIDSGYRHFNVKDNATLTFAEDCGIVITNVDHRIGKGGGGILVSGNNGTFHMKGGTIIGNRAQVRGGGVEIASGTIGARFIMEGGEISYNVAGHGGGVYAYGECIISGGKISDNTSELGGGVYAYSECILSGGEISKNTAFDGGGVAVASVNGMFTMTGGKISGNNAAQQGGGVYSYNGARVIIEGGEISGNKAGVNGGGVTTMGGGTMSGGEIINNEAGVNGGGVSVDALGTFTIIDGKISGNNAVRQGGGVYNNIGTRLVIEDGEITGNEAGVSGGGVYSEERFTMSGGEISKNTSEFGGGVILTDGGILSGGEIIKNTAFDGGGVVVMGGGGGKFTMTGGKISGNKAEGGTLGGGGICAIGDFEMQDGEISGNTTTLDGGGVFGVRPVTIKDGKISGNNAARRGGGIYCHIGTPVIIEGGEISGNYANENGGGIAAMGGGTMSGGEITGNEADVNGGGVSVEAVGKFTMTGGKISSNEALGGFGGGVYAAANREFEMKNSEIIGNKAGQGGGVYSLGEFTMNNAVIRNNTAALGGGVFAGARVIMEDGSIIGNSADYGGGMFLTRTALSMDYESGITGNTAEVDGGGIFTVGHNQLKIDSGAMFSGNSAGAGAYWVEDYETDRNYTDDGVVFSTGTVLGGVMGAGGTIINVGELLNFLKNGDGPDRYIKTESMSASPSLFGRPLTYLVNNYDINFNMHGQVRKAPSVSSMPLHFGSHKITFAPQWIMLREAWEARASMEPADTPTNPNQWGFKIENPNEAVLATTHVTVEASAYEGCGVLAGRMFAGEDKLDVSGGAAVYKFNPYGYHIWEGSALRIGWDDLKIGGIPKDIRVQNGFALSSNMPLGERKVTLTWNVISAP